MLRVTRALTDQRGKRAVGAEYFDGQGRRREQRADLFGGELRDFMREGSRGLVSMVGVREDLSLKQNRVDPGNRRDKYGMRTARVVHAIDPESRKTWHVAVRQGIKIFAAAGAKQAWNSPPGGQHVMGGTIMGAAPARSVTNEYAQPHDIANLFTGGAGAFPTRSCVNPTVTLHALAMKSAGRIIRRWGALT